MSKSIYICAHNEQKSPVKYISIGECKKDLTPVALTHRYVTLYLVTIGSGNGLSPSWHQSIPKPEVVSRTFRNKFHSNSNKKLISFLVKAFWNVVCKMLAALLW